MTIHKEGYPSIIVTLIIVALINAFTHWLFSAYPIILWLGYALSAFLLIVILQFFRSPKRTIIINENNMIPFEYQIEAQNKITKYLVMKNQRQY